MIAGIIWQWIKCSSSTTNIPILINYIQVSFSCVICHQAICGISFVIVAMTLLVTSTIQWPLINKSILSVFIFILFWLCKYMLIIMFILKSFYYHVFLFIVHYYLHKLFFASFIVFICVTFMRGICISYLAANIPVMVYLWQSYNLQVKII